jgi:transposase
MSEQVKQIDHTGTPAATEYATAHLVFELSKANWRLGVVLPGSQKMSSYTIAGGDLQALALRLADIRGKAGRGGQPVRVVSCYEAGLDGHWLHRWLTAQGVVSYEVDPASVEVDRRARRAKTDRIDLEKLMRTLLAFLRGEPRVCSMVRVPSVEEEDHKRRTRERDCLLGERTAHTNRIKGLLQGQGIRDAMPMKPDFIASLDKMSTGDGHLLADRLKQENKREHARLCVVGQQIRELEAASAAEQRAPVKGSSAAKIAQLMDLKGIGPVGGQMLVNEVFYRSFDNRRQVGSYFGLTGTPYDSGQSRREQGISKAGNRRARTIAIELAWLWLRHQPGSPLSCWFRKRVGDLKGRIRRLTIVAVARKLMIELWRYVTTGVVPAGAVLSSSK